MHLERAAPVRSGAALLTLAALAGCATACATAVENPPVYDSERFLCAEASSDAWRDAVADCREAFDRDKSCGGVVSFKGQLEGEPLTVDAEISNSEFIDLHVDGAELRQEIKLSANSPYFRFVLSWLDMGGDLVGGADGSELRFGTTTDADSVLEDDLVRASIRMTVGGESRAFAPRRGELLSERQRLHEQVATFTAELGDSGDYLEGCFHAFAIDHRITREVSSDVGR